jgi:hypothetical protein
LVNVRIALSATDPPRNSQTSPVAAASNASSNVTLAVACADTGVGYGTAMRIPWKLIGLAGLAGVAATGVVVVRRRRTQRQYTPEELRARLHQRLADVPSGNGQTEPIPSNR